MSAAGGSAATADTVRTTADGGREIVIKLDPEHLGSVAIRLRLKGSAVDVAITVSNPATLGTLDRDRHLLTAALASAGMSGETLSLATGTPDATGHASAFTQTGAQPGDPGQSQNGSAAASGDPSNTGGRRRDEQPGISRSADRSSAENRDPEQERSRGLYV